MNRINAIAIALTAAAGLSGTAAAAPAQDAIEACKVAVEKSVGNDVMSRLTKIKSRGPNYEVWLNVRGDETEQRTYCFLRRGEVQQMVTEDGQWKGRNPRRPENVEVG